MDGWKPALPEAAVTAAGLHAARVGGEAVLLLRAAGDLCAYRDACPHEGYPLSQFAAREGDLIVCGKHLWEFAGADGRRVSRIDRAQCNLVRYPVRVCGGMIEVDVSKPSHALKQVPPSLQDPA